MKLKNESGKSSDDKDESRVQRKDEDDATLKQWSSPECDSQPGGQGA